MSQSNNDLRCLKAATVAIGSDVFKRRQAVGPPVEVLRV